MNKNNQKLKWRDWPYWIKGGLLGGIILSGWRVAEIILSLNQDRRSMDGADPFFILINLILLFSFGAVIGTAIGYFIDFIIGRTKLRKTPVRK